MENLDQEGTKGKQDNSDQSAKCEIPLWLQGLEESSSDRSSPEPVPPDLDSDWVTENVSPETLPIEGHQEKSKAAGPHETEGAEFEIDLDAALGEQQNLSQITTDEEVNKPEVLTVDEVSVEKGFIEIPEYDLSEDSELTEKQDEEMIRDEEALPDWLHEMIAESPEFTLEETIPSMVIEPDDEVVDEPTEPVDITQETLIEVEEDLVVESEVPLEAIEEKEEKPDLIAESIPDQPDSVEEIDLEPEEEVQVGDLPSRLLFAKHLLDQGYIKRAAEIFSSFSGQPIYRKQIKDWLMQAADEEKETKSDLWETIGDIEMQNGDSELAFIAYAKAINFLLLAVSDTDETD